ncbi:Mitochondrial intermediate peptidase [Rhodotorula toruloides]
MMRAAFGRAGRAIRPSPTATPRLAVPSCSCGFRTLAAKQAQTIDVQPLPTPTDKQLHQAFDTPSSSYTASPSSVAPTGLFGQPALTSPDDFPSLAHRTTLRAKILVNRICRPARPPQSLEEAEGAFLDMVKNLDRLSDLLCGVIDLAELVRNVHPDPRWVEGANEAYEQLCEYMNELNTHVGLYQGLKTLHSMLPPETPTKSPALFAAYAVATPFIRDFEKSGIHLPSEQRAEFVSLSTAILQLGRRFLQNAAEPEGEDLVKVSRKSLDAAFGPALAQRLAGDLPDSQQDVLIDPLSWEGRIIARHHPSASIRRDLYVASHSSSPSHVETLEDLLLARGKLARLVGRTSWADVALEDKMAQTPEAVMGFLDALEKHNRPLAQKDLEVLRRAKAAHLAKTGTGGGRGKEDARVIEAWDRDFYTDLSAAANGTANALPDISPFFSVGAVFAGLSRFFTALYGIRFEVEDVREGEVWAKGVRKLRVIDEDEGMIGTIYCDLFSRQGKAPGAAHYTVRCSRRVDDDDVEGDFEGRSYAEVDGVRLERDQLEGLVVEPVEWKGRPGKHQEPIVVLVCAFGSSDASGRPAFLQWHEVETLHHEMGHAIHSMIGRNEYHNVAGTRCATDFVEFPSVLMEHFVSSPAVIALSAKHYNTGHPLPTEIFETLLKERSRFSALETSSQIMMAALDQSYHSSAVADSATSGLTFDSTAALAEVQDRYHVIPYADGSTWQTQFGHLFGYGATYYSYLFDRAIAAHVFSVKFAENPLSRERGEELKQGVLRWGGGKDPWEMIGGLVGSEKVAKGGRAAMEEVGKWGILEG